MKIRDVMTKNVVSCGKDSNLAAAGALMWENDCGILPVVDETNKVIGVMTDRDICIALCTRNARPSDLTAREVATATTLSCSPNQDVRTALTTMREAKVHRLPVVDGGGILQGIVSLDDVVMCAQEKDGKGGTDVPLEDVVHTFQAVCTHHQTRPLVVVTG